MNRDAVDQATRNDIAAAPAAHHELGRDYDDAVAESLVDRIGAEIDKRVDAKLQAGSSGSRSPAEFTRSGKTQVMSAGAVIGGGIIGVAAIIANAGNHSNAVTVSVIAVWFILVITGLGAALVRRYRSK